MEKWLDRILVLTWILLAYSVSIGLLWFAIMGFISVKGIPIGIIALLVSIMIFAMAIKFTQSLIIDLKEK